MREKIKKLYVKFQRGFAELLEFPFKGILNSFILAIVVIIAILLIAAARQSFGAPKAPTNNIPISKTATPGTNYPVLAAKIYKKVYKLDRAIQTTGKKEEVVGGLPPSKALEISKLDKKTQKNKKN
ncbi:MAG: hypothetical protein ACYDDB_04205 [bacterium]